MKKCIKAGLLCAALLAAPRLLAPLGISFRSFDHEGYTRVVFQSERAFAYSLDVQADRLQLRLSGRADFPAPSVAVSNSPLLDRVTCEQRGEGSVLTVHFRGAASVSKSFVLEKPFRVVFDLVRAEKAPLPMPPLPQVPSPAVQKDDDPAAPAAAPHPKPIETICLDPGHGGEDFGAIGRSKLKEKDVTLKIALKLKKLIESRTGLRVIMTRDKDSEVSLNTRASIANNQLAQMFISIHANSSFRKSAYGSETYFVSLQATDPEALELAQKENQNDEDPGEAIQNDELKMILWNMAQTEHIRESSRLAEAIQNELNQLLGTRNRGVKQAPFRVLMRTAMPAVLIETVFISNPSEERRLQGDDFLERIAQAIYNGVSKFIYAYNGSLK
jgi:N-acetylmuramoyl-L-alanine amidase